MFKNTLYGIWLLLITIFIAGCVESESDSASDSASEQEVDEYITNSSNNIIATNRLRKTYIDYSAARNHYGGFNNAPLYPNTTSFAVLDNDGYIASWGNEEYGGSGAHTNGYVQIFSTGSAFAALNADGSITSWGNDQFKNSPKGDGYTAIYSNYAFAALNAEGSITSWGVIIGI